MREAYTLLRQSIIHVEQDDIDFDEEELEGERERDRRPRANQVDAEDSQDVEMSEIAAMEETEQSFNESMGINGEGSSGLNGAARSDATSRAGSMAAKPVPPPVAPKRRMVITHDKYMTLQSLIVLHLSQIERETGRGVDRDELIDWYLELKESEIQDVEELEYEKELITKMLRKLVKVGSSFLCYIARISVNVLLQDNYLIEIKGDVQDSLPTSMEESSGQPSFDTQDGNVRVYYMVHPSVDTESSSSIS